MTSSRRKRRTWVGLGIAGLVTGALLLTSAPPPAHSQPASQPGKAPANPPAATEAQKKLAGAEKAVAPVGLAKRLSLDLRAMDVLAVLKFLAEQGDFNVVPGKNVGGRVTLAVKDITIQDALDIIALTNELAYVVQSRVIHVMTEADYQKLFGSPFADQREVKTVHLQYADAGTVATVLGNVKSTVGRVVADPATRTIILIDVPDKMAQMVTAVEGMDRSAQLHTKAFELRYGKAADVKPEVEKALTPKLGAVRLDKRTNTLVVTDLASQMPEIQQIIRAFDRRTREVVIQAKIVEVRLEDRLQIGIDWEVLFRALVNVDMRQVFPAPGPAITTGGKLILGTFASDNWRAVLDLLQSVGKTNILSTPQIAVVENEEAKILVGTKQAYVTSAVTQTQQAATTAEQVTFVDVGLQFKVAPTINDEGFVTMKIRPEVSSVTDTLTTAAGNRIPIVDTSSAETTVMVRDGNTLVIAGLIKEEKTNTARKFPILGDIPILGFFFRSQEDRKLKTELLFFLTPTIFSGGESVGVVRPELHKYHEPDDEEFDE
jgi:type II secretory pathway component GspD/PulD (secretin)